jgi:hypothetical protein
MEQSKTQIADVSVESILAEKALDAALTKPGDVCTYEALKGALGKDPQGEAYSYVFSARRRFERKKDCVLDVLPKTGIRWLTAEEVVKLKFERDADHLRRSQKRALRRQKTALNTDSEKALGPEGIRKRNQNLAFLGTLTAMSKPKMERTIAAAADQSSRVLGAMEVLKLLGNGNGKRDET